MVVFSFCFRFYCFSLLLRIRTLFFLLPFLAFYWLSIFFLTFFPIPLFAFFISCILFLLLEFLHIFCFPMFYSRISYFLVSCVPSVILLSFVFLEFLRLNLFSSSFLYFLRFVYLIFPLLLFLQFSLLFFTSFVPFFFIALCISFTLRFPLFLLDPLLTRHRLFST